MEERLCKQQQILISPWEKWHTFRVKRKNKKLNSTISSHHSFIEFSIHLTKYGLNDYWAPTLCQHSWIKIDRNPEFRNFLVHWKKTQGKYHPNKKISYNKCSEGKIHHKLEHKTRACDLPHGVGKGKFPRQSDNWAEICRWTKVKGLEFQCTTLFKIFIF